VKVPSGHGHVMAGMAGIVIAGMAEPRPGVNAGMAGIVIAGVPEPRPGVMAGIGKGIG